jgi:hypothetical protein
MQTIAAQKTMLIVFSARLPTSEEEDLDMLGYIDQVRQRDIESVQGEGDGNP